MRLNKPSPEPITTDRVLEKLVKAGSPQPFRYAGISFQASLMVEEICDEPARSTVARYDSSGS